VVIKTINKPHPESARAPTSSSTSSRVNEQFAEQANARAVQQDMSKARDIQCNWAKDRYMKAITSRRVYKEGKDGERQYISDADADAYREQARKDVQQLCGSVPDWKPDQAIPEPQPVPEPKVSPAEAASR
jgi:adenine-specific DNA methylase